MHLPRPPPTSFSRKTLHVALDSLAELEDRISPRTLLLQALSAKVDDGVSSPLLAQLRSQSSSEGNTDPLGDILADDSQLFVSSFPQFGDSTTGNRAASGPSHHSSSSIAKPANAPSADDDQPLYRPFSVISPSSTSRTLRRRSQSLTDGELKSTFSALSPLQALSEEIENLPHGTSPERLKRRPSESVIRSSTNGNGSNLWESFEKAGFGDAPGPSLELSPNTTPTALVPQRRYDSISAGFEKIDHPSRNRISMVTYPPTVQAEQVIDVDDLFLAFTEDGQFDPSTTSWPAYALVRLKKPVPHGDSQHKIEWLLVTLTFVAPPIEVPSEDAPKRSISPGAMSTSSRFGSSLGLFRRTSSSMSIRNTGARRSIFGNTHRPEPRHSKSVTNLESLPESRSAPVRGDTGGTSPPKSAVSAAPTEYTLTDFGEMVKIAPAAESSTPTYDVSLETKSEDWAYRAEGAAHLIFAYRGSNSTYQHQVLRMAKVHRDAVSPDTAAKSLVWEKDLLPSLLRADLLVQKFSVEMDARWLKKLLKSQLSHRPSSRQAEMGNVDIMDVFKEGGTAWVMENLTDGKEKQGEATLCFEIKVSDESLPPQLQLTPTKA